MQIRTNRSQFWTVERTWRRDWSRREGRWEAKRQIARSRSRYVDGRTRRRAVTSIKHVRVVDAQASTIVWWSSGGVEAFGHRRADRRAIVRRSVRQQRAREEHALTHAPLGDADGLSPVDEDFPWPGPAKHTRRYAGSPSSAPVVQRDVARSTSGVNAVFHHVPARSEPTWTSPDQRSSVRGNPPVDPEVAGSSSTSPPPPRRRRIGVCVRVVRVEYVERWLLPSTRTGRSHRHDHASRATLPDRKFVVVVELVDLESLTRPVAGTEPTTDRGRAGDAIATTDHRAHAVQSASANRSLRADGRPFACCDGDRPRRRWSTRVAHRDFAGRRDRSCRRVRGSTRTDSCREASNDRRVNGGVRTFEGSLTMS